MDKQQVIKLAEHITSMYSFVSIDETYLTIWERTTRKADYNKTIERFFKYISDPANKHRPPLPADIVVTINPDGSAKERKKMAQYEQEAKNNPPTKEQLEQLKRMMQRVSD